MSNLKVDPEIIRNAELLAQYAIQAPPVPGWFPVKRMEQVIVDRNGRKRVDWAFETEEEREFRWRWYFAMKIQDGVIQIMEESTKLTT